MSATSPTVRLVWQPVPSDATLGAAPERLRGRTVIIIGGRPDEAASVASTLAGYGCRTRAIPTDAGVDGEARIVAELGVADAIVDLNVSGRFALERAGAWEGPLLQTVRVLQACY